MGVYIVCKTGYNAAIYRKQQLSNIRVSILQKNENTNLLCPALQHLIISMILCTYNENPHKI